MRLLPIFAPFVLLSALLSGLPAASAAEDFVCAPKQMLKVIVQADIPGLPPTHFARAPKTMYRYEQNLARVEEQADPVSGVRLLMIVHEPDIWVIDRAKNTGEHTVDPGPTYRVRMRIFPDSVKSQAIRDLEFGCEVQMMTKAGAKTRTEGDVTMYELADGKETALLKTDTASGKPLRVELYYGDKRMAALDYKQYAMTTPVDELLFSKPEGVQISEKPAQ